MKRLGIFLSLVLFARTALFAAEGPAAPPMPVDVDQSQERWMLNNAIFKGDEREVGMILINNRDLRRNINKVDNTGLTPMTLATMLRQNFRL